MLGLASVEGGEVCCRGDTGAESIAWGEGIAGLGVSLPEDVYGVVEDLCQSEELGVGGHKFEDIGGNGEGSGAGLWGEMGWEEGENKEGGVTGEVDSSCSADGILSVGTELLVGEEQIEVGIVGEEVVKGVNLFWEIGVAVLPEDAGLGVVGKPLGDDALMVIVLCPHSLAFEFQQGLSVGYSRADKGTEIRPVVIGIPGEGVEVLWGEERGEVSVFEGMVFKEEEAEAGDGCGVCFLEEELLKRYFVWLEGQQDFLDVWIHRAISSKRLALRVIIHLIPTLGGGKINASSPMNATFHRVQDGILLRTVNKGIKWC